MQRTGFLMAWIVLGWTVGCASAPPHLPACTPVNSPNAICGLMNPEDLGLLPGGDWIVVSQMAHSDREAEPGAQPAKPGSLLAVRASGDARHRIFPPDSGSGPPESEAAPLAGWGDAACPGRPSPSHFQPHGIDVGRHASGVPMLAVVNHGEREAVEFFEIDGRQAAPALRWRGCVEMPEDLMANDVALYAGGSFVVTKFMPPIRSLGFGALWSLMKVSAGWNTGAVYRWVPGGDVTLIAGSEGSAPNGIEISRDETQIFVAQWGEENVYRFSISDDGRATGRAEAALAHRPDNLTWTEDGRLLAAGQSGSIGSIVGCGEIEDGGCGLDYGVYSIDPESLAVTPLFTGKGAASVALEFGDDVFVGSFVGDQIERVSRPR